MNFPLVGERGAFSHLGWMIRFCFREVGGGIQRVTHDAHLDEHGSSVKPVIVAGERQRFEPTVLDHSSKRRSGLLQPRSALFKVQNFIQRGGSIRNGLPPNLDFCRQQFVVYRGFLGQQIWRIRRFNTGGSRA